MFGKFLSLSIGGFAGYYYAKNQATIDSLISSFGDKMKDLWQIGFSSNALISVNPSGVPDRTDWQQEIGTMGNPSVTQPVQDIFCQFKIGEINWQSGMFEMITRADEEPVLLSFDRQEKFTPHQVASFVFEREYTTKSGDIITVTGYDRYTTGEPFVKFIFLPLTKTMEHRDLTNQCKENGN